MARKAAWKITAEYVDHGISGAKGRDKRPAFDDLCKAATRREFDVVMAWSVDRLGRSLRHLVTFFDELKDCRVDLYLHQEGIDTTTPSGVAMFQMVGVFAQFERSMISERVCEGISRARANGKKLGRPRITKQTEADILVRRAAGMSMNAISRELGVGSSQVQRVLRVKS